MADFDVCRLLVSDHYDAVGAARNSAKMNDHAAALKGAGVFRDADGEYRTASGETAAQFLSNLLVYGSGAVRPATQTPSDDRAKYDGLTKADYDALPYHKQAEIRDKVDGPARPRWMDRVKTPVVDAAQAAKDAPLTPEQKIALGNARIARANGWNVGPLND